MEIEGFRVTLKAREYERTCRFYGKVLALPELDRFEREDLRGTRFQAGAGTIEVLGRVPGTPRRTDDHAFEYRGPDHKLVLSLVVPSPERAYEELILRDRDLPGGLRQEENGTTVFLTYDPDGMKVLLRRAGE